MFNGINDYTKVLLQRYGRINDMTLLNMENLESINLNILIASICVVFIFSMGLIYLLGNTIMTK